MKKLITLSTLLLSLVFSGELMAGTSEVKWTNPDSYRDIHAGEGHRAKFKARVFSAFEEHFSTFAKKLPENQTLLIDVKDVDLAGDVHHGGMQRIRVVKDIHFPRMDFSYQLIDENKQVISAGDVKLKDMNFMMGASLRYRREQLGHEKKMLNQWFNETFTKPNH